MKIVVKYYMPIEQEVELTPEEYCNMRANTASRPDIFPEESWNRQIPHYDDMSPENQQELDDFWDRG